MPDVIGMAQQIDLPWTEPHAGYVAIASRAFHEEAEGIASSFRKDTHERIARRPSVSERRGGHPSAQATRAPYAGGVGASPWTVNQSTASRRPCSTEVWGNPSSRTAFAALKYMRLRAMRTPVSGTRGGWPVARATPSLTSATR